MAVPDSLPQRIFVLAHNPDKGRVGVGTSLGAMLRAAALTDLYLSGHLTDERGRAAIDVRRPCHDPVLQALLEEIAGSRPRKWQSWIDRRQSAAVSAVRQQLSAGGWVRLQPHRILGLFPTTKVTVRDPRVRKELLGRVNGTLKKPIDRIDPADAGLVAIVAAGELNLVLDAKPGAPTDSASRNSPRSADRSAPPCANRSRTHTAAKAVRAYGMRGWVRLWLPNTVVPQHIRPSCDPRPAGTSRRPRPAPTSAWGAREAREEIGLTVTEADLGDPVAWGAGRVEAWPDTGVFRDDYFHLRVDRHEVDTSAMETFEAANHVGHRWWSTADLAQTTARVIPFALARLLSTLTCGRVPAEPVQLPWHH